MSPRRRSTVGRLVEVEGVGFGRIVHDGETYVELAIGRRRGHRVPRKALRRHPTVPLAFTTAEPPATRLHKGRTTR